MIVMVTNRKLVLTTTLLLFPLLGGCVGMSIIHPGKFGSIQGPNVSCKVPDSPGCMGSIGNSCDALIRHWGDPAKTSVSGQQRRLTYKQGLSWAGIMPIVIVPIPLAVPSGHKTVTFTCDGDNVVEASGITTKNSGLYCGLLMSNDGFSLGCDNT